MPKPKKGNRSSGEVALDQIPDRAQKQHYTEEQKRKAVAMLKTMSGDEVAAKLGIPSPSVIFNWKAKFEGGGGTKKASTAAGLELSAVRADLQRAARERDERLECAAVIIDAEGSKAVAIARSIRAMQTSPPPAPSTKKKK